MSIRDATSADLSRILAITNEAIANTTTTFNLTPMTLEARRDWMAERQERGCPVLVATGADGDVVGFGSFGPFRPWEGFLHTVEHSLYVDPLAHSRGHGTALLAELVLRAKAAGLHAMIGGVDAGNAASMALHRRAGFTEVGRLPEVGRKFDRWLDLVFLHRIVA